MLSIDDILGIASEEDFDRAALRLFRWQSARCAPYRDYLALIGVDPAAVTRVRDIPFLPIEIFKTHRVWCGEGGATGGPEPEPGATTGPEPEAVFTSSATGGQGASRHYIASLADYERVYTRGFELFYGPASGWSIFALLPSYLQREGSSLVRMADGLIRRGREAGRGGGFYLRDHKQLMCDMTGGNAHGEKSGDRSPDKILLGVTYALLDLAEELIARGETLPPGVIVMETGGMKGRRAEISKQQLHSTLRTAFGLPAIHSEYGMAELMSQAWSTGGGIFKTPPWMRIYVRDLADPFDVRREGRGGINAIDLGNLHSCAFIQTQDVGRIAPGEGFTIDGRIERADIRGCNLLVQ